MRLYLCFIAAFLISLHGIVSASVELSNPKAIMGGSVIIKPNRRPEFSARLSPDGKYILFPQQIDAIKDTYKLFLRNIETGDEIEIPVELPSGYDTVFTRFNFFNPRGDKLSLLSVDKDKNISEIVIFDISSKKLKKTGNAGNSAMAQFDFTGERLVVSQDNINFLMRLDGWVVIGKDVKSGGGAPNPYITSGWVHSCSTKTPFAAIFVPKTRQNQAEFKLLNLNNYETFNLPVHSKNQGLDDIASHWSSDGSYMFYMDVKYDISGNAKQVTRVWDVNSNKEKAVIPDALCLGPGPASNLMIMISTDTNSGSGNLRSYDIKMGTLSSIGTGSIKGVHAWSRKIAYVETAEGVIGKLYIADISEK